MMRSDVGDQHVLSLSARNDTTGGSRALLARQHRTKALPGFALEAHHLQLLQRREVGRAGLDPRARQVDPDHEIEVGCLLHDVLAREIVTALPQYLLETLGDAV